MKFLAIYFTANGQWKLINGSIPTIFPHNAQGKKRRARKKIPAQVFSLNFAEFLKTLFLGTSLVAASEDEHNETHDIPIEQMLSLNDLF